MDIEDVESILNRLLAGFTDPRAAGLSCGDVIPSDLPGYATIKRSCLCNFQRTYYRCYGVPIVGTWFPSGNPHHHVLEIGGELWYAWSAALGWPQITA